MKDLRLTKEEAGRLCRVVAYTQPMGFEPPRARAAKSRMSSLARQKLNARAMWEKLELLIAENFDRDDLFVTLTYRDPPATREEALRRLGKFLDAMRSARRLRGCELMYIKNVEHLRDDGSEGRWHHHLILNATGADFEEIRALWAAWGDNIEIEFLGEDFGGRARYMCKEKAPTGKQTWTPSRGLRRPKRTSELVDGSVNISELELLAQGCRILEKREERNEWGHFLYLKYLRPLQPPPMASFRPRGDGGPDEIQTWGSVYP